MQKSSNAEVMRGLRTAGWILLTIITFALLLGGGFAAFSIVPNRKLLGWSALISGFAILVFNIERWAKILPGILALATLNAMLTLISGHSINNTSVAVRRDFALAVTVLLAASCAMSMQFYGRRLGLLDRIVLLLFVACLLWGMVSTFHLAPLIAGLALLSLAWLKRRFSLASLA